MNIKLHDGSVLELQDGINALDAAKQIDQALYKAALACEINGEPSSLVTPLKDGDELKICTWDTMTELFCMISISRSKTGKFSEYSAIPDVEKVLFSNI